VQHPFHQETGDGREKDESTPRVSAFWQWFDAVGWVTESTSSEKENCVSLVPSGSVLEQMQEEN